MYIQQITLNTGHNQPHSLFEVDKSVIEVCKTLITDSLTDGRVELPLPHGEYQLQCTPNNSQLVATVFNGQVPIVTMGVCKKSNGAKALWDLLETTYQTVYNAKPKAERPQAPWVGVIALPGSIGDPAIPMIADMEQCLAWAWLDILRERKND